MRSPIRSISSNVPRNAFGDDVFAIDARLPPVTFGISQPLPDSFAMSLISRRNHSRSAGGRIMLLPSADRLRMLDSLAR
ncbi:hypothetical protein DF048_35230 [Burkholderia seminalis]|nr:hypothetical protein DF048_35230 [Burkholderia seminalis]